MSATMTPEMEREASRVIFEKIASHDLVMQKAGAADIDDFVRLRMREEGFFRQLMPPKPITNADLDRQWDTALPAKIVDREVDSPGSITVPFASLPMSYYIQGDRFRVLFSRILSPRFTKDVDELRTFVMDLRTVISDNSIKDMLAEEDTNFLRAVNTALVGPDLVVPSSGSVQWKTIYGGIGRDTLADITKVTQSTPMSIPTQTMLINTITAAEVMKVTGNETGTGAFAEDIFVNGMRNKDQIMGIKIVQTIKRGLVPNNTFYLFGDQKFFGKSYELEAPTMWLRREAFFIDWFHYESLGAGIGNTAAVGRVDVK